MIGGVENVSSYEAHVAQQDMPDQSSELGQDSFLKLLVAQMQHQDPLNPQGNEEFIAQLAQFTSLEQLMGVNTALGDLYAATTSMNNASMTQLLGRDVTAFSDTISYDGEGPQEIHFSAPAERTTTEIASAGASAMWSSTFWTTLGHSFGTSDTDRNNSRTIFAGSPCIASICSF